jgi:phosphatidylglycerophosphatase A
MKLNFFTKLLGSGFYTGYFPFATGTFGSMAALLIYFIPGFENNYIIIPAIIIFFAAGVYTGNIFDEVYGKDPAECTIDEIVGMWITLLFVPKSFWIAVAAFFIWRLMDIVKPYPARKLEKLKGGLGVMMDDVVAGFYSFLAVHILLYIFG